MVVEVDKVSANGSARETEVDSTAYGSVALGVIPFVLEAIEQIAGNTQRSRALEDRATLLMLNPSSAAICSGLEASECHVVVSRRGQSFPRQRSISWDPKGTTPAPGVGVNSPK